MKNIKIFFFVIVYLKLLSPICTGQTIFEKVESIVKKYDKQNGYNGLIIIGFGVDSILKFEYGYKDPITKKEDISLNDCFDLASLTKQFTGLTILDLIEKGIIHPNDSIGKYLPELSPALQKVTVKQLANHTNGIHDFYSLTARHDTLNSHKVMSMLSKLDTTVFAPGTKWGYTNSGYLLLSEIIERATKLSFQEYCLRSILIPLGMESACFNTEDNQVLKGYKSNLEPIKFNSFSSGESGLYASGKDIIAYYQNICRNTDNWDKYFSQSYNLSDQSNTPNWNYGFGWYFSQDSLGKFRAHSGRNPGANTYIKLYDDSNILICLLSNKGDDYFKALREEIANLVISEIK